jgi:hypothetical protein
VSRKKETQPDLGFSSCKQNVFFGKETPNPNLTCILSFLKFVLKFYNCAITRTGNENL